MNITRPVVGLVACLSLGAVILAVADPPSSAPVASSQAAAAQTAPAATATAATAAQSAPTSAKSQTAPAAKAAETPSSDVADANLEKHFLSEGYALEMHHGEKMFCRREEDLGSRLGGKKYCSTAQQLNATEMQAQRAMDPSTWQQNQPTGR